MITASEIAFRMSMLEPDVDNATAGRGLDAEDREDVLRQEALEQTLADAPLFSLAREEGLIDYRDHAGFLADLDRENAERARSLSRGEIVYGLTEFTPEQYYTRTLTQLRNELIRTLSTDGGPLAVDDAQVRAYFDEHADRWQAAAATYRVRTWTLPAQEGNDPTCGRTLMAAADGGPVAAIRSSCSGVEVARAELDGSARPETASPEGLALSAVGLLEVGQATAPLPDADHVTVYQLLAKDVDEDAAFAAYRERVRQSLLTERFEALVAERREADDPDIDRSALESITTEES